MWVRLAAMVPRVKPYRNRRLKFLAQRHPELLRELEDTGLILSHGRGLGDCRTRRQGEFGRSRNLFRRGLGDNRAVCPR
jgi:hypothetical protein